MELVSAATAGCCGRLWRGGRAAETAAAVAAAAANGYISKQTRERSSSCPHVGRSRAAEEADRRRGNKLSLNEYKGIEHRNQIKGMQ